MTERSIFQNPDVIIAQERQNLLYFKESIEREFKHLITDQKRQLNLSDNLSFKPLFYLERGYAYIESSEVQL